MTRQKKKLMISTQWLFQKIWVFFVLPRYVIIYITIKKYDEENVS